ncbi:MAG: GIY-YIG nuclease family protein [Patescibacteria group bacterium]|nr:GIY-YIG nuclease family protein [Patescibacteria group bacterium]
MGANVAERNESKGMFFVEDMPFVLRSSMEYYVYLARCSDGTLYVGECSDIRAREIRHNKGTGASYTKYRRPVRKIYFEKYSSLVDARKRETQIKKWSRNKKERLLSCGTSMKI